MFAHAMSSTTPVMPSSMRSGVRASRCIELWPCLPGSSTIFFDLKRVIVASLIDC